jgi:hypothetical protein
LGQPFQVDGLTSPAPATAWIRPLETYTETAGNGLAITRLTEPHPTEQQIASSQWWRELFPRPLFLLTTTRKPPGPAKG